MKYKKKRQIDELIQKTNEDIADIVNQIICLYPQLKDDKMLIINKLKNKEEKQINIDTELIFDKIILDNNIYYKDKNNYLWNSDASIVGIYDYDSVYYLFSSVDELNKELDIDITHLNIIQPIQNHHN
jgi:hypothetical protein